MSVSMKGGCFCQNIQYTIHAELKGCCICHCRSCQKATGGTNFAVLVVGKDDFEISGALSCHSAPGASGQPVHRHFCGQCGTTIMGHPEVMGELRTISAVTLDDPSQVEVGMELWLEDAQSWDCPLENTTKFEKNPG